MKKIFIVSPRAPSGLSWVNNCFLELGIRTYMSDLSGEDKMWIKDQGYYYLNPQLNDTKKWLPVLSKSEKFIFNSEIEAEWTHDWPTAKHDGHKIIFFIRDPRDALFSLYQRTGAKIKFSEFIRFLEPNTLLSVIENWYLFNQCWLSHKNLKVFRFEDYKINAHQTLGNILKFIEFEETETLINRAVIASDFNLARKSEEDYIKNNPRDLDKAIVNRNGKSGYWKDFTKAEDIKAIKEIESELAEMILYFGYEPGQKKFQKAENDYFSHLLLLPSFENVKIPAEICKTGSQYLFWNVIEFAINLDKNLLLDSGLKDWQIIVLIITIKKYLINWFNLVTGIEKIETGSGEIFIEDTNLENIFTEKLTALVKTEGNKIGLESLNNDNFLFAEKIFSILCRLKNPQADYFFNLGLAILKQGKYKEAILPLSESLKMNYLTYESYYYLGYCLEKIGEAKVSELYYQKAAKLKK